MTLKIDTCPFCGGQPDFENTDERARLRCRECGAESGVFFYSEEERESGIGVETENRCAEAWNRRVSGSAEPVAWLQIGVGGHEGDRLVRLHKPEEGKYNREWWRFEPLYGAPPNTSAKDAALLLAKETLDGFVGENATERLMAREAVAAINAAMAKEKTT